MLEFDKNKIDSMASMAGTSVGPGRLPSRKTWLVGGGLLVLVLGGYWYLNGRGEGAGDKRGNAAPVRVAVVEQRVFRKPGDE